MPDGSVELKIVTTEKGDIKEVTKPIEVSKDVDKEIVEDLSKVKLPLIIRTRKTGDKMQVKNLGTKKVKDILINEKIDIDKRNNIPIVIDSKNNILWLPGIKKSKFDVGKNEKYDIILLCERK